MSSSVRAGRRTFRWRPGARYGKLPAQVVGRELERIRSQNGVLSPDLVVDAARSSRSPLHRVFEWDDSVAAQKHREEQARLLIRSIRVIVRNDPDAKPRRMYLNVRDGGTSEYKASLEIMEDADERAMVVARALSDLRSFKARYAEILEIGDLVDQLMRAVRGKRRSA